MAQQYKRMRVRRYEQIEDRETPEGKYWKKFKQPVLTKHYGSISCIDFSPAQPHDFCVTAATRVTIYDSKACSSRRTISRFRDDAYSARYRRKGNLIVAGGKDPQVQVFNAKNKTIMRRFKGHKAAVHVTHFSPNNIQVVSASDDKTVRCWDVPTEKGVLTINQAHTDHIRTACCSPLGADIWATGSFDHTVKLWDFRASGGAQMKPTLQLDNEHPVEQVLVLPGGATVLSTADNTIKAWDVLSGGKLLHTFGSHAKTITSLSLDGTGTRLLSGSADGHVKVYDLQTFKPVYGFKYPAPVLSIACSPDNSRLVVGMLDGMLSMRQRIVKTEESFLSEKRTKTMHGGSYKYFVRGRSSTASHDDFTVRAGHKLRLRDHDMYLKKFQHRKALDAALQTRDPVVVVSMFEELVRRDSLAAALTGRDDAALAPVLAFIVRYIARPRFSSCLIDVANSLFDLYAPALGRSAAIDDLFLRLQRAVRTELALEKELLTLQGSLDLVLAAASAAPGTGTGAGGGAGAGAGARAGAGAGANGVAADDDEDAVDALMQALDDGDAPAESSR